jgi:hypothetical protein
MAQLRNSRKAEKPSGLISYEVALIPDACSFVIDVAVKSEH